MRLVFLTLACASAASANVLASIGHGVGRETNTVLQPVLETVIGVSSSQCTAVKRLIGLDYSQVEGKKEPDVNQLSLKYVAPKLNISFNINTVSDALLKIPENQKLVIYIHGFTDSPEKGSFADVSQAFISTGTAHVLALDGSSLIAFLYLRSSTYVRFMGEKLGSILADVVAAGFNPDNLHIVGHSLGAQIAGFTGKQFTNRTQGLQVGRISGLDPAGPCFTNVNEELRLQSTDAKQVDVIHTDAGVFGLDTPVGQVDFYPNEGSTQPKCLVNTCSHSRAWQYFAESVRNPKAFPAVRCVSWDAFKKGNCEEEISYMGLGATPGLSGRYYLQTNGEPPFSRGINGTKFINNEGLLKTLLG